MPGEPEARHGNGANFATETRLLHGRFAMRVGVSNRLLCSLALSSLTSAAAQTGLLPVCCLPWVERKLIREHGGSPWLRGIILVFPPLTFLQCWIYE